MGFLLAMLVIAIIVIFFLASHNNDVDARVKALADAERQHLQGEQKKYIERKNREFEKLCAEKQAEYKTLCENKNAEFNKLCNDKNADFNKLCNDKNAEYCKLCTKAQTEYEAATKLKQEYQDIMNKIDSIIQQKFNIYPHLAAVMSDILTAYFENSARYLENKPHPALTEAFRIRQLRQDTQKIIEEKKILEYQIAYIRQMIPNIDDLLDSGFIDNDAEFEVESEETTDRVRFFLSPEEYKNLSSIERNQLALDRYIAGRKSKWQVGRDYEMYIGHLYENKGCSVEYMGIIKGLEDLGRDLIVKKDKKTSIIQCKNWSKEKTIHEKHIFQLFGTVVLYNIEHPNAEAKGIFISTTALSDTALQVAQELGIQTVQKDIGNFPRIKCNINRTTGERIYHLPFDQQYDSVVIEKNKGEFYALTIDQAERQGFRRAFRHYI